MGDTCQNSCLSLPPPLPPFYWLIFPPPHNSIVPLQSHPLLWDLGEFGGVQWTLLPEGGGHANTDLEKQMDWPTGPLGSWPTGTLPPLGAGLRALDKAWFRSYFLKMGDDDKCVDFQLFQGGEIQEDCSCFFNPN